MVLQVYVIVSGIFVIVTRICGIISEKFVIVTRIYVTLTRKYVTVTQIFAKVSGIFVKVTRKYYPSSYKQNTYQKLPVWEFVGFVSNRRKIFSPSFGCLEQYNTTGTIYAQVNKPMLKEMFHLFR